MKSSSLTAQELANKGQAVVVFRRRRKVPIGIVSCHAFETSEQAFFDCADLAADGSLRRRSNVAVSEVNALLSHEMSRFSIPVAPCTQNNRNTRARILTELLIELVASRDPKRNNMSRLYMYVHVCLRQSAISAVWVVFRDVHCLIRFAAGPHEVGAERAVGPIASSHADRVTQRLVWRCSR